MSKAALGNRHKAIRLDRYAGEWLVFANDKVAAHDKSLPEAMSKASKKKLKGKPSVFLVPRKDEGPYLLFL